MKIMIVDDDYESRLLLRKFLCLEGHDIIEAVNGLDSISVFKNDKPDIVLMDVLMPIMNGFEAAYQIKRIAGAEYVPVIFLTGLDDRATILKCLGAGGDDFIGKPFDRLVLIAKINAHSRIKDLNTQIKNKNTELEYHNNRVQLEHKIVEKIFNNAVDNGRENYDFIDFNLSPASMFNGDLLLIEPSPFDGFYVLLGDFTGHGLAASIGVLPISDAFRTLARAGRSIGDIAIHLNRLLYRLLPESMFCAAAIMELQKSSRRLTVWSGGFPDIYVIDKNKKLKETIESMHMSLGIMDESEFDYSTKSIILSGDERIILCTDGVIETEDASGEMLGEKRLIDFITRHDFEAVEQVIAYAEEFRGIEKQSDDLTIAQIFFDKLCKSVSVSGKVDVDDFSIPFEASFVVDIEKITFSDPVFEIVEVLSGNQGVANHKDNIYTIVSELVSNAIDYGLLGLDSSIKDNGAGLIEYSKARNKALNDRQDGYIKVDVKYANNHDEKKIYLSVESSIGPPVYELKKERAPDSIGGRGIDIINALCESFDVFDNGKRVRAVYNFRP